MNCPTCHRPEAPARLLTIAQVARELGVDRKTARRYLVKHRVPVIPLGVIHKRVDRRDLERMLAAMKATGPKALAAMTDRRVGAPAAGARFAAAWAGHGGRA